MNSLKQIRAVNFDNKYEFTQHPTCYQVDFADTEHHKITKKANMNE